MTLTASSWEPVLRARTGVYVSAFVCMGLSVGLIGPLLPFIKARTRADANALSAWFACRGVGGFTGSLLGGAALDRTGGHRVVTASLLLLAFVVALVPSATSAEGLAVLFLLFDLAVGGLQSCNALMAWAHAGATSASLSAAAALNGLNAAFGVGTLLAPLLPLAVGDARWAWSARIVALLILPCAAFAHSISSPAHVAASPVAHASPHAAGTRRVLVVALTALFLLLVVGAETTLGAFLVLYTDSLPQRHAKAASSHAEGDVLTTAFWVSFTAGRLLMGVAASRAKPRNILAFELALLCASITLVIAAPASRSALYIGVLGCGLGLSGCFGGAVGQAAELTPLTGRVNGVFGAGAVTGVAMVQLTASQAAARWGNGGIMATVAAASYAAAAVMLGLWVLVPSARVASGAEHERGRLLEHVELGELDGGDGHGQRAASPPGKRRSSRDDEGDM